MKDHKWLLFLKKHSKRLIAFCVAAAILLSLVFTGTLADFIEKLRQPEKAGQATETTSPTKPKETKPKDNPTTEEELKQTEVILTQKLEKDPNNTELLCNRAAVYFNLGKYEEAIQDYTAALALKEDPKTRYHRAIVYGLSGNHKLAHEDLSVALQANPENKDYLSLMADTCNALKLYDEALACLEKLLVKEPDNCVLLTLAGDACVYLKDYQKAVELYEKAVACYTEETEESEISKASLYSAYGNALKILERYAEAAKIYGESLALESNKELYFQRGFCLLQTEKYNDAAADFTKCIELGYEVASSSFQRGLCYYAKGSYSKAIKDFKIYEAAFPKNTDSFLYMGLCYQNEKDYASAISYYEKCIKANISKGNCYFNIGNCYYNMKEYSDAVSYYTKSIDSKSYLYESLLNRGICYIELNKYNEAKVDLKRVIDECSDKDLVASATKSYDPIKNITIITKGG